MSTGIGLGVMVNNMFSRPQRFAGEMGHIPVVPGGNICRWPRLFGNGGQRMGTH
jgi:predicted NBD/HSP70 family sugar kinase